MTMKAVGVYKPLPVDDPDSLVDVEVDEPVAGERDLVVRVKAISVNPVDYKRRSWKTDDGKLQILGWDVSGVVEEAGRGCSIFQPGDEVYYAGSSMRPGGNAELNAVDERIVGRKPSSLSFTEAAAMPLTTITAWEGMFDRMHIPLDPENNSGKTIFYIGAAGGVGSIGTQLAKLAGLTAIGSASRPETVKWTKEHGTEHVIDHRRPFREQLEQAGFDSVDYIFCTNSITQYWDQITDIIAPGGKICSIIGAPEHFHEMALMTKSISFVYEYMFTRPIYQTPDMIYQHELLNRVSELIDSGKIRTTMNELISPINAASLRNAHAKLESGKAIGKIVLQGF